MPVNQGLALRNPQALIATRESLLLLMHLQAFTFSFYLFVDQKYTRGLTKSDPVHCVEYDYERSHLSFSPFVSYMLFFPLGSHFQDSGFRCEGLCHLNLTFSSRFCNNGSLGSLGDRFGFLKIGLSRYRSIFICGLLPSEHVGPLLALLLIRVPESPGMSVSHVRAFSFRETIRSDAPRPPNTDECSVTSGKFVLQA